MKVVGIDPGVNTGYALWDCKELKFLAIASFSILECMERVLIAEPDLLLFEDARKRNIFTKMDAEQKKYGAAVREGVGSVKRDCTIWEDFCLRHGIPFIARRPCTTKVKADMFMRITGWKERTNEHARDAGMIVYGLNLPAAKAQLAAVQRAVSIPTHGRRDPVSVGSGSIARHGDDPV